MRKPLKKIYFMMFLSLIIFSGCGANKDSKSESSAIESDMGTMESDTENESSDSRNLPDKKITDLWEQIEVKDEKNVLEFVTGLQIVLPEEWKDKIIIRTEPAVQSYGGGIVVCEKKNAEADAGGTLFLLEYFKYDEAAIAPYEIFGTDKVLGVYHRGEDIYALVFELPREMNYAEGNEEMKKAYEEVSTFVDKVQIITEHMEGFTECELDDLDWIVLSGYEEPESVGMLKYDGAGFEMEYPSVWEVKEETGEDGRE